MPPIIATNLVANECPSNVQYHECINWASLLPAHLHKGQITIPWVRILITCLIHSKRKYFPTFSSRIIVSLEFALYPHATNSVEKKECDREGRYKLHLKWPLPWRGHQCGSTSGSALWILSQVSNRWSKTESTSHSSDAIILKGRLFKKRSGCCHIRQCILLQSKGD